ncbi:RNA polymerase sigma factor [Cohnella terricola]|uniref:RNA polymerase sigma factor n=1 Tax=Cohnella terricola TaxID=1289167 RepID=A0A559JEF8_9BACL|nr:RNA polymerase sigma factor [Cohnella terricola]TVX98247.1 RNA polymerase sigma factor [Cohnella terricola]
MEKSLLRASKEMIDDPYAENPRFALPDAYDRHVDTVYRVCYSLMGNRQDAEDATHSVFVKLLESDKLFNDSEHEKAWLITAAQNHCRDLHRKWWKKKVVDLDAGTLKLASTDAVRDRDLEDYLRKLPPTNRLVLYLHYYEGYKVNEIAEMLKLNPNTVKTQMRTARNRLKLEMGEDPRE